MATEKLTMLSRNHVPAAFQPFLVKSSTLDDYFSKIQLAVICATISRVLRRQLDLITAYPDKISTFSEKILALEYRLAQCQPLLIVLA